jgi:hypothetical protein
MQLIINKTLFIIKQIDENNNFKIISSGKNETEIIQKALKDKDFNIFYNKYKSEINIPYDLSTYRIEIANNEIKQLKG